MKPINSEVRLLIVRARELGQTIESTAYLYAVGQTTVKRFKKMSKETGNLQPKPFTGRKSCVTEEIMEAILEKIKKEPDATLQTIIDDLNLPIGKSQLHRLLTKRGYSFKKKLFIQRHNKEMM
jgi:transposase